MSFSRILILAICFLFSVSSVYATELVKIENAWSPEAPPVAKVMAGYMKISNLSNKDIKIKSANSNFFTKVEIHRTELKDGMFTMIKQDNLLIKAKSHIELKQGGLHMMLMGKLKPIREGSIIPVKLNFNNNETVQVNLKVKSGNRPQMKCGSGKCGSM